MPGVYREGISFSVGRNSSGVCEEYVLSTGNMPSADEVNLCAHSIKAQRVVVDVNQLLALLGNTCHFEQCQQPLMNRKVKLDGCAVFLSWSCLVGHHGTWCSSSGHKVNCVLTNNVMFSAASLISGNSFRKLQLFCNFFGLACISKSTYYR